MIEGADKDDVEVVFCSHDKTVAEFKEYYGVAMGPWAAVPFAAVDKRDALDAKFAVTTIPRAVVLRGSDGSVVNADAREAINKAKRLPGVFS